MATNYVTAKYQEIYDLSTQSDTLSIIGIHSPTGTKPQELLSGFFRQFRKYIYKGCTVTMVPAAQLPADPLQVSYEAGETIDPRDLLNPILFHGCHGDSLNSALDIIYKNTAFDNSGSSIDMADTAFSDGSVFQSEGAYYAAMSDPSFRKFMVQQGIRLNLHPMVQDVVSNTAAISPEFLPTFDSTGTSNGVVWNGNQAQQVTAYSPVANQIFSQGVRPLGWLPTRVFTNQASGAVPVLATLPKVFMGVLLLPPSYKQELYFRMVITHYFAFKDFTSSLVPGIGPTNDGFGEVADYNDFLPTSAGTSSLEIIDGKSELRTCGVS